MKKENGVKMFFWEIRLKVSLKHLNKISVFSCLFEKYSFFHKTAIELYSSTELRRLKRVAQIKMFMLCLVRYLEEMATLLQC